MSKNYKKLADYLNNPDNNPAPPLGVEGEFFDRIVRLHEHIQIPGLRNFYEWENADLDSEKVISLGLRCFEIDFDNNLITCNLTPCDSSFLTLSYYHKTSKSDVEFLSNFNRLFNSESFHKAIRLLQYGED